MDKGSCSATPESGGGSCGTSGKQGTCCGKIIKGAILGGLVMYAWFMVSWMALPWHKDTLMAFKDEKAVAQSITANAPQSGVYVIPFTDMGKLDQKTKTPFAFVSVFADGVDVKATMTQTMLKALALCLVMAGFLSCLLTKKTEGYCPVAFSMKVGLMVGLGAFVPLWVWYHFPLSYVGTGIADEIVAFALAGMVVGKCVMKMKLGCCPASACGPSACGPSACTAKEGDAEKK